MKIVHVPIEPLEERYSADWKIWFLSYLKNLPVADWMWVEPEPLTSVIEEGEFLDVVGTNYFKAVQLAQLCKDIKAKKICDGDVILFHDLWFPGLEMLFYIRDLLGIDFKVGGYLHAGSYLPYDFLEVNNLQRWADKIEKAWFEEADFIIVATEYHKRKINNTRGIPPKKIRVLPFPLEWSTSQEKEVKKDIIVFPHRMCFFKGWEKFQKVESRLREVLPDWKVVCTMKDCSTKQEYYSALCDAKVIVSTSNGETWGIAMQEGVLSGCVPVVPDAYSYSEMYPSDFLYPFDLGVEEIADEIVQAATNYQAIISGEAYRKCLGEFLYKGHAAIGKTDHFLRRAYSKKRTIPSMFPVLTDYCFKLIGMQRSGNHAVVEWLIGQLQEAGFSGCFLNHCDLGSDPFGTYREASFASDKKYLPMYGDTTPLLKKGFVLYSYEDEDPEQALSEVLPEKWVGQSKRFRNVVVIRDPWNMIASRLLWSLKGKVYPGGTFPITDSKSLNHVINLWLRYARFVMGQEITNAATVINFNYWFTDRTYRESIAINLDIPFSDVGKQKVANVGPAYWNSGSFDGNHYDGRAGEMDVLLRWQAMVDEPLMQEAIANEELYLCAKKWFPEVANALPV